MKQNKIHENDNAYNKMESNQWNKYKNDYPILIGGGVGIAPILNLHNHLNELNIRHSLICGAQRKNEHLKMKIDNKIEFEKKYKRKVS